MRVRGGGDMHTQFEELESEWLRALQNDDSETLDRLLDSAFVCTPWSPDGNLLLKDEYLRDVRHARFKDCGVNPIHVLTIGQFAIVRCRVSCEYFAGDRTWTVEMLLTDIWVQREGLWKALNRDLTPISGRRLVPTLVTDRKEPARESLR
jgi:hypothetical protein